MQSNTQSKLETEVADFFSQDGKLASVVGDYQVRQQQVDLSVSIARTLEQSSALVAEAGTGTGKTFAYLVPALLAADKKVIVSTGTKNLQEQLFKRDLPLVKDLVGQSKEVALLKGRSNYLCLHRSKINEVSTRGFEKDTLQDFKIVQKWSAGTKTGDMSELSSLQEDAKILPLVTSTVDNCLGKDCSYYDECHLVKARQKAMQADIVVVNHHLFFADLSLKEQGFGELIPAVNSIIFDEAHLIPDIASEYFGEHFSTRQLSDQLKDLIKLQKVALKDASQISEFANKCVYALSDIRLLFPEEATRGNWQHKLQQNDVQEKFSTFTEQMAQLVDVIRLHEGRDKDIDSLLEKIDKNASELPKFLDTEQKDVSLWYETTKYHLVVHITPLSIAKQFENVMSQRDASWIFTSATLAIDGQFDHFVSLMGLKEAKTLCFDSPFDYKNQAMLCVPRYLPEPSSELMHSALVKIAKQLIVAAKGRCFILFTSHFMMRKTAKSVAEDLDSFEILVQGERAKSALLERYLDNEKSVLFATGAFWEGVDVKGDDLLCVLIDKLPFASPDDPLLKARIDDYAKQGGNAFMDIQIPQAVISLKQGAGRLIRDVNDKGVLIICDNRLVTKPYGHLFTDSLPSMHKTRDLSVVTKFLESID